MHRSSTSATAGLSQLLSAAVVLLVLLGVFAIPHVDQLPGGLEEFFERRITLAKLSLLGIILIIWSLSAHAFGLTELRSHPNSYRELLQIAKACTVTSGFALLLPLTSHSGAFTYTMVAGFWLFSIPAVFGSRLAAERLARIEGGVREILIVGSGPRAERAYENLTAQGNSSLRVIGFVDSPNNHKVPELIKRRMLGGLDQLENLLVHSPVDEVLIALPVRSCYEGIQTAIRTCERVGVESQYLSDIFQVALASPRYVSGPESPVVALKVATDDYRLVVKRAIDLLGAAIGLLFLSPLMLGVALAVKLTSPGPVFFTQERFGFHRRRFRMYKFRTMVQNAEDLQSSLEARNEVRGPVFKIKNDPRITQIGSFLRKSSLDELPQFINVLRGDMSLVGPRPLPLRDVSRFSDACLMRRFSVKPGLTCFWQINGRSNTDFDQWITLDLKYIDNWSLSLDLRILAQTLPAVLKGRGAA